MDGYVVIGTRLDTKQLETDLKNAKKELTGFQKEEERLLKEKGKIELDLSSYDSEEKKIRETTQLDMQKATTKKQINNLISLENKLLNDLAVKYSKQFTSLDEINSKLEQNKTNQGLINNKVQEINKNLEKSKGIDKIKDNIKNVNSGLTDTVKKVGRWALAIFSVRSAYNLVRQASGTLAQYNEQYANNLEYLRYVLAQTLAPALEYLVNLAYKLLSYVNYIANAWFGVNLFSRASAKNFNKMAGSAEKIKKSLQTAGFDEMNILSDTSSGASAGGVTTPSMDLSAMEGEVPEWIKWIAEHKDEVIQGLLGIATGLLGVHLGLKLIEGLGLIALIKGIVGLIQDIVEFIKDPSWQNFFKILGDIALIIGGIMLLMGSWWGLLVVIVGAIVKLVAENWDKVKETLGVVGDWIYNHIIKPVGDFFSNLWQSILDGVTNAYNWVKDVLSTVGNWIYDHIIKPVGDFFSGLWDGIITGVSNAVQWVKDKFHAVVDFFGNLIQRIVNKFRELGSNVGNAIAGAFKAVVNGVLRAVERILNSPIRAVNRLIDVINAVPGINLGYLPTFYLPRLKTGGIINMPGRGIPVGSAIAGEAGAEGVIPLTDSQAMETLGEAIGKYITINATILNRMDSRVISRQLQQIKNANDFAYNS